jgi:hypothetical protein
MSSRLLTLLLCVVLLAGLTVTTAQATVNLESGKVGIRISDAGSVRFVVPSTSGTRQLDRINFIAALSEQAVCDYNEDHDAGDLAAAAVAAPLKADVEGLVHFTSRYANLPPNLLFRLHTYMWKDQAFVVAQYTVINDSSDQVTLHLGALAVPRINGSYGGETDKYDPVTEIAYAYRGDEAAYAGIRLLSSTPYSYKALDWNVYSPADPNSDAATDSTRYHQTADPGFGPEVLAGGDGSIFSLNAGPYTLAPHDSVVLFYGFVFGSTFKEMAAAANAAQAAYSLKIAENPKTTNFDSGKIGVRLSNAGSIRLLSPNTSGLWQIARVNIIAALSETAVCDYNENHNPLDGTVMLTSPTLADIEGFVHFDSRYYDSEDPASKPLPPNMSFDVHSYMWTDQSYLIAEFTATNDSTEALNFFLGAVAVPSVGDNYGGETNKYHAETQMAYCYREGESDYSGLCLLSHTAYSYKALDWNDYSPDDPAADAATDSTRYHQTADAGFDPDMVASGDGSIFSLNAGSFTLAPHASVKLAYGIVYANSVDELIANANAMRAKYASLFTGVELKPGEQQPEAFALSQNWPNPFNPTTAIRFELLERSEVRLAVYNLKGQLVNTVAAGVYPAGAHQVVWDGRDAAGQNAAAGVYIYRLQAGKQSWTKKMTLVR